jgi:hypothetical protein
MKTYDTQHISNKWTATSRFYSCAPGEGTTELEAIRKLEKNIKQFALNKPKSFKAELQNQLQVLKDAGEQPLFVKT